VIGEETRIRIWQAFCRASLFVIIPNAPSFCFSIYSRDMTLHEMQVPPIMYVAFAVGMAYYALKCGIFLTARERNGFAGLHDILSGTRVIAKPTLKRSTLAPALPEQFETSRESEKVGPYHVLQTLCERDSDCLYLAYDTKLLRRVWLRKQSVGAPKVDSISRNLGRTSRLRWLGGRRSEDESWDCYEAPEGMPLTIAIKNGLSFAAVADGFRDLTQELARACEETSLPNRLSLSQLWITEDGALKVLPFAMDPEGYPDGMDGIEVDPEDSEQAALQLLHRTAECVAGEIQLTGATKGGVTGAALRDVATLHELSNVASLEEANHAAQSLGRGSLTAVRWRIAGMLAASISVPAFLLASTAIAGFAIEQQKKSMPQVTELAHVMQLIDIEQRLNEPEKLEHIAAMETYVSANFRDLLSNPAKMDSFYALTVIPVARRGRFPQIIDSPLPDEKAAAEAKAVFEEVDGKIRSIMPASMSFLSGVGLVFLSAVAWMEVIWIPSLLTSVLFRGGALMWVFGLTLVRRDGRPASRLRVFIRNLLGGIPAFAIAWFYLQSQFVNSENASAAQWILAAVVLILLVAALYGRKRLLQDRLAGTYIVAR
ncbi:MAG: hypothetical protein ACR2NZ_15065, partial [Rubripirellula sp.]